MFINHRFHSLLLSHTRSIEISRLWSLTLILGVKLMVNHTDYIYISQDNYASQQVAVTVVNSQGDRKALPTLKEVTAVVLLRMKVILLSVKVQF